MRPLLSPPAKRPHKDTSFIPAIPPLSPPPPEAACRPRLQREGPVAPATPPPPPPKATVQFPKPPIVGKPLMEVAKHFEGARSIATRSRAGATAREVPATVRAVRRGLRATLLVSAPAADPYPLGVPTVSDVVTGMTTPSPSCISPHSYQ